MHDDQIALEASQASITTATVTIKALRVNSRQLTQSTFRQLPEEPLVDESEVRLLGIVWGWVNYQPPGSPANCTQFVAQFGDRLCRSPFHVRLLPGDTTFEFEQKRFAYREEAALGVLAYIAANPSELVRYRVDPKESIALAFAIKDRAPFPRLVFREGHDEWQDMRADIRLFNDILWPHEYCQGERLLSKDEAKDAALARLKKRLEDRGVELSKPPPWWEARLDGIASQALDYVNRWNALMETLKSAEQLYIAT